MTPKEWATARRADIERNHPGTAAATDEIRRLKKLESDGDELAYDLSVAQGNGNLFDCERIAAEMSARDGVDDEEAA